MEFFFLTKNYLKRKIEIFTIHTRSRVYELYMITVGMTMIYHIRRRVFSSPVIAYFMQAGQRNMAQVYYTIDDKTIKYVFQFGSKRASRLDSKANCHAGIIVTRLVCD